MKILIIVVLSGIVIYFLFKICLYFYRPFLLEKMILELQTQYDQLLIIIDKSTEEAAEQYKNIQSGDRISILANSEDDLKGNLEKEIASKKHIQEVNNKFIRLRERFIGDYKKLSEAIVAYRRFLNMRANQYKNAEIYSRALGIGSMSFDEFIASANEDRIAIEESERRLDVLLGG